MAAFEGDTEGADVSTALGLLALIAGQDVEQGEDGTWKIAQKVAPERVISTVDPESRHMRKSRAEYRDGYKAHIAVEPETGLVTSAVVTPANVSDAKTALELVATEAAGLEILGDAAYGSGETRASLRQRGHRQLIKPIPLRRAIAVASTVTTSSSIIAGNDHLPGRHHRRHRPKGPGNLRRQMSGLRAPTPLHHIKKGMALTIHPHDDELVAARASMESKRRARGVPTMASDGRALHCVARGQGNRRVRFRGVEKNQLGLSLRVAALNLRRMVNLGLDHDGEWLIRAA